MENQHRIKSIYKMLIELATGNLAFRLQPDLSDVEYNEIVSLLNETAKKMQELKVIHPVFKLKSLPDQSPAIEILRKVQDYIMTHLEEPLPTTHELSKMFGTNEFTLKEIFRDLLNTSIYQFYNSERLKKAHYLIERTNLPLKEIGILCGFNQYRNFAKAFKKKYKKAPSEIFRGI